MSNLNKKKKINKFRNCDDDEKKRNNDEKKSFS